jgi:hypothetical protein
MQNFSKYKIKSSRKSDVGKPLLTFHKEIARYCAERKQYIIKVNFEQKVFNSMLLHFSDERRK